MDLDPPTSRKRTVDAVSPHSNPAESHDTAPRILNRRHHRRRNVAASIWGPDIPLTSCPTSEPTPVSNPPVPPPPFNIYKSLLRHPNLFFQFALRLPLPSAISLYAIDKEFHYLFNKYSVSIIHDYARYWAPISSHVFSWILYPGLCISDPMLRPMDERQWLARDVPGWRWVGMVLHRQQIIRGIVTALALEGLRVPRKMEEVLCKFWVLMEFRYSHLRLSFLQDKDIWTDADICLFHLFLVKLDMRFSDPILGNGTCSLSHLVLTQPSLTTLYKILTGKSKLTYDATTRLLVLAYPTDSLDLDAFPWLDDEIDNGVDEEHLGILMKEGWAETGTPMDSAVDMVITEGLRRELHVQRWLLDFVVYGHVDRGGKGLPLVRKWRRNGVREYGGWCGGRDRRRVVEGLDVRFGLKSGDDGEEKMDFSI